MNFAKDLSRALLLLAIAGAASADALDDILERGTLRIAIAEFVPLAMKAKTGGHIGYDVDIGRKIAADMGVEAEFVVYEWENIIPAIDKREVDIMVGSMAITPARALRVNFSRPLGTSGAGLATNTAKTRDIETLEQLNNPEIVVVTVTDTFGDGVARTVFNEATIRAYAARDLAEKEILEGRAHAFVSSQPAVQFLAMTNPDVIDVPLSEPLLAFSEAAAVRRGEQGLLNFINAWVTARTTDKWLETTNEYWFSTLDWVEDMDR